MRQIANNNDLKLMLVTLSASGPTDLSGIGAVDLKRQKSSYLPMDMFPVEGDPLPVKTPAVYKRDVDGAVVVEDGAKVVEKPATYYKGWLLFLDELPSANPATIKAACKIILDKMVGIKPLNKRVVVAAAGNLTTDGAMSGKLPTQMMSRMVTLRMAVSAKEWAEHAMDKGFNHKIVSFVQNAPDKLHVFNPKDLQESGEDSFPCPRTYEFASKVMNKREENTEFNTVDRVVLAGCLGQRMAMDFITYCNVYAHLPTVAAIVNDPVYCDVPQDRGHQFALCGMLRGSINESNIVAIIEYTKRMHVEFQMITIQSAVRKNTKLIHLPEVKAWLQHNSKPI